MYIIRVLAQNFLCFIKMQLDLLDLGLISLYGINHRSTSQNNNGAGKSALFEALYFALYGKMLRNILSKEIPTRASILEQAGEKTKGTFSIVSFVNSQTKEIYQVERFHSHPKLKNELFLWLYNDPDAPELTEEPIALMDKPTLVAQDLRGADKDETQRKIIKLIGLSRDMFRQVTLFGKGGMPCFSGLSDTAKKQLLEEILQIHLYTKAEKIAKDRRKEEKEELRVLANKRIQQLEIIDQKRSRLIDLVQRQDQWTRDRSAKFEALGNQIRDLERTTEKEPPCVTQEQIDAAKKQLAAENDNHQETIKELQEKIPPLEKQIRDADKEYARITAERSGLEKEVNRRSKLIDSGSCPTCGQTVDDAVFPGSTELNEQIDSLVDQQSKQYTVCQTLPVNKRNIEREIEAEKERFSKRYWELDQQHDTLYKGKINYDQWAFKQEHKQHEIDALKERVQQTREEISPFEELLASERKELEQHVRKEEETRKERDAVDQEIKKLNVLVNVFGTKGIRSFLLENLLPEVNERLFEYADIMTSGELVAQLSIQSETAKGEKREKISIIVQTKTGENVRYESCSSGEQRRLDVPLALALQDLSLARGQGLGLSLLDEVFENVDEAGVENMMELLHCVSKRKGINTTIVVTHNEQLNQRFNHGIVVERDVNGSSCCFGV